MSDPDRCGRSPAVGVERAREFPLVEHKIAKVLLEVLLQSFWAPICRISFVLTGGRLFLFVIGVNCHDFAVWAQELDVRIDGNFVFMLGLLDGSG